MKSRTLKIVALLFLVWLAISSLRFVDIVLNSTAITAILVLVYIVGVYLVLFKTTASFPIWSVVSTIVAMFAIRAFGFVSVAACGFESSTNPELGCVIASNFLKAVILASFLILPVAAVRRLIKTAKGGATNPTQ